MVENDSEGLFRSLGDKRTKCKPRTLWVKQDLTAVASTVVNVRKHVSWVCTTDTEMESLTIAEDILNIGLYIHKIEAGIDRSFSVKSIILLSDSRIRCRDRFVVLSVLTVKL